MTHYLRSINQLFLEYVVSAIISLPLSIVFVYLIYRATGGSITPISWVTYWTIGTVVLYLSGAGNYILRITPSYIIRK